MRNLIGAIWLALGLVLLAGADAHAATAVETLYVRAQPSIPLLSTPSEAAVTIRQLAPGDALTVLGRQGGFVNVQAADGVQGWLRETDLTGVAPPSRRVTELEQQAATLREELSTARNALQRVEARLRQAQQAAAAAHESGADRSTALEAENTALQERLSAANAEIVRLEARVAQLETEQQMARQAAQLLSARQPSSNALDASRFSDLELAAAAAAALLLAVLGAWFGTTNAHRRLRRRYHGLEL